jgi:non-ribosomal peptide synthetase component F
MFVSTLPFRIKFEDKWSFNELVAFIKKELWESLKHQGYPYNHLVKDLKDLDIDTSSLLNVQLIELPGGNQEEVAKRVFFSTQHNISQLSIYLNEQNTKDLVELDVAIDYHQDIFEEREIEFFFKRLIIILEQAIKEPGKQIAELSLLEDAEYKELIFELNDTKAAFPGEKTLPQLFEEQVLKNPGNTALEYEDKTVIYEELKDLTGKLAAKLQAAGITPDSIVGMLCERSIEAIVCIIGVLKAGGAYLPIDPAYPLERKNYIIKNSGVKTLLIEKALEQEETEFLDNNREIKTMIIDYQTLEKETINTNFKKPALSSENLAYVIYTSGTTGNPKGTLLRHRNVINYIWWGAGVYVKGETVSFPLYTSLSFDLTVTSIFIPLITGNKIVIYRDSKEVLLIERVVKENKVDIIKLTPS